MTRRDTHDQVADLLGPLALGVLDPAERARAERHVASCARCQDALAELTETAGLLGRLTPDEVDSGALLPSAGFADRVVTEIAARRRAAEARMRRLQVVLAGASALAVLVGGIATATGLSREAPPAATVEALRVTSAPGVQAEARAIAHTWGVEIVLTATGFEKGTTYAVEVLDRQGVRSTAGAFVGTGARTMVPAQLRGAPPRRGVVPRPGRRRCRAGHRHPRVTPVPADPRSTAHVHALCAGRERGRRAQCAVDHQVTCTGLAGVSRADHLSIT